MFIPRFYYVLFGTLFSYGHKFQRTETEEKIRHIEITSQLVKNLFNDYEPWLRPEPNVADNVPSVQIRVNLTITDLLFSQESKKLILNALLCQQWLDKRLQYTPRVPFVILPKGKQTWTPQTVLMDAIDAHKENFDDQFSVRVYPSGNVLHLQRKSVEVPCRTDLNYYPLKNVWYCSFTISSVSYSNQDVVYQWNSIGHKLSENGKEPPVFDLKQDFCIGETSFGNYSCLKLTFIFKGSFIQSLIYIYFPSTLLIVCSLLHFWIQSSAVVPRTLSALVPFGTFSVFMLTRRNLENEKISALDVWLIFCTCYTFLSFFQYVISVWYWMRKSSNVKDKSERILLMETDFQFAKENCRSMKKSWMDLISRIVFLFSFVGFLIFYVVYYFIF